jgi:flagellar biosynthetic protein FliO
MTMRIERLQHDPKRGAFLAVATLFVVCGVFSPHVSGGAQVVQARTVSERAAALAQANVEEDDTIPFMKREAERAKFASGDGFALGRALGALLLVLGLLAFGVFLVKRFGPNRTPAQSAPVAVAVLKSVPLGDRRALLVVHFAGKNLLLGSTPHGISLLDSDDDLAPAAAPTSVAVGDLLDFNASVPPNEAGDFSERRRA